MSRLVAISEVAEVNPGFPRTANLSPESQVSFLPMAAVSESGEITSQVERLFSEVSKGYTYFAEGDVLLAKITPCMENGKATFVQKLIYPAGFGSTEFHVLRPGSEIDGKYLFYMIWNPLFRKVAALNMTGTAGQKRVPSSFLKDFKIPLPPLPEQKRIAAILDKVDSIRRKRQKAVQLTEELRRSLFMDMFGDPVTNPKGWKEARLEDVAEIVSGVTKGRKLDGKQTVSAPYLRVANVQDGYLDLSEIKEVEVLPSDIAKYRLLDGDILLTEGGDPDKLGRGTVWRDHIEDCIHQNHIFRVRIKADTLRSDFLSVLLGSERGKRYFLRAAKQTTGIASINSTQLKNFPVLIPTLDLQQRFAKSVVSTQKLKKIFIDTEYTTNSLFSSLLQRAFMGLL